MHQSSARRGYNPQILFSLLTCPSSATYLSFGCLPQLAPLIYRRRCLSAVKESNLLLYLARGSPTSTLLRRKPDQLRENGSLVSLNSRMSFLQYPPWSLLHSHASSLSSSSLRMSLVAVHPLAFSVSAHVARHDFRCHTGGDSSSRNLIQKGSRS
ncbi:hypothetical protein DL96DRAFT_1012180 [Flagelloscypha sp. PMI_526]|nr:hypothetical protein DL96DRAFT_1012180 [Flagelloscypha sp. PMI_526]